MLSRRPATRRPCMGNGRHAVRPAPRQQHIRRNLWALAAAEDAPSASASESEASASSAEEPAPADESIEVRAVRRFQRGSPSKFRRVLNVIRGKSYEEALTTLTFIPYRAAEPILSLLLTAAASAKHNHGMRKSRLYVSTCYAGDGPTLKRIRARAQGRAYKIRKRTSHVTVKVKELPEGAKLRVKRTGIYPQRKGVRQTS